MNRSILAALLVSMAAFSVHQDRAESAPLSASEKDVTTDAKEKSNAAATTAEKERHEFVAKAEKDLGDLKVKMHDLEQKAATETGEAKDKLVQQMKRLKKEMKLAGQKLEKLKSAAGNTWKNFASDV